MCLENVVSCVVLVKVGFCEEGLLCCYFEVDWVW